MALIFGEEYKPECWCHQHQLYHKVVQYNPAMTAAFEHNSNEQNFIGCMIQHVTLEM
jgi:hypothetical protein